MHVHVFRYNRSYNFNNSLLHSWMHYMLPKKHSDSNKRLYFLMWKIIHKYWQPSSSSGIQFRAERDLDYTTVKLNDDISSELSSQHTSPQRTSDAIRRDAISAEHDSNVISNYFVSSSLCNCPQKPIITQTVYNVMFWIYAYKPVIKDDGNIYRIHEKAHLGMMITMKKRPTRMRQVEGKDEDETFAISSETCGIFAGEDKTANFYKR